MDIEQAKKHLCLALDVNSLSEAKKIAELLKDYVGLYKIGFQLFTKEGPKAVEVIRNIGGNVFLDLKYHDIPNIVANSAREAVNIGAYIFNVHASGGSEMMRAAVEATEEESQKRNIPKPIVIAVTLLTSINSEILSKEICSIHNVNDQVIHFAKLAKSAKVSGVVASPKEIKNIKKNCGNDFIILTPGIRPLWSVGKDDQKRITTPGEAIRLGSSYIVIGRPILKVNDPIEAVKKILNEMTDSNE
jgi:orotidine-5'-phosphate decarboxylase